MELPCLGKKEVYIWVYEREKRRGGAEYASTRRGVLSVSYLSFWKVQLVGQGPSNNQMAWLEAAW